MRRGKKGAAIVVGAVLVLSFGLWLLVRVVVTPERVKRVLLPKISEALDRQVSVDTLHISIFSGIELQDVVIREKKGSESFVTAERAVLSYQFWPLLSRRIVIDEVRLESPTVRVERYPDETFNFSDLLRKFQDDQKEEEQGVTDLLVSEVEVVNGKVLFLDHTLGNGAPYRMQFTDLRLAASDISPSDSFPWEIGGRMGSGTLSASGDVDPKTLKGNVQLKVVSLDVAPFAPYLRQTLPGQLNAMTLSADLSAEGGKDRVVSEGIVRIQGIDFIMRKKSGEEVSIHNASLGLDYALKGDLKGKSLIVQKSTLTANGIPVHLSGTVAGYDVTPKLDIQVEIPEIDLRPAFKSLPAALLPTALAGVDPAGKVSGRARLTGETREGKKLLQSGELQAKEVALNLGKARVDLSGVVRLTGGSAVSEGLILRRGEERATIDLAVTDIFGEIIKVKSSVRADRLSLDPFFGAPGSAKDQKAPPSGSRSPVSARKPLDVPIRSEGTVQIGRTVYKGVAIENLALQHSYEKGVVTLPRVSGRISGGTFNTRARLDLGQLPSPFSLTLALRGVQADPLVTAFFPKATGVVFGSMDLNTSLQGVGTEGAEIRRSLSGEGDLLLQDGQLTGAGPVKGLAEYLNLEELRVLRFSTLKGSFTANDGKLRIDSELNGKEIRMHPVGTLALENYALDVALQPRFSPALTRKLDSRGTVSKFLVDSQGWGQVPLKVGGTLSSPRFFLDASRVRAAVKERAEVEIRKRVQERVEKILPRKKEETPPTGEKPTGDSLEETLRGLIGQ